MPSSTILPYSVEAYLRFYEDEFMARFTHSSLATGICDLTKAHEYVKRLNQSATQLESSISFNAEMLTRDQLEGGACSAIAFRVAEKAFELITELKQKGLSPLNQDKVFAIRLLNFVRQLETIATSQRSADKLSQKAIRTEQLAFNTITVDRNRVTRGNAVEGKIGAMAPFYRLKVVDSSPEIRVKGNPHLDEQLKEQMKTLKKGIYLLRIIQEKYNHKLEEKGHSVVYIKSERSEYYFDPALGFYTLFPEIDKPHLLFNALLSANDRFGVDVLSFHRLKQQTPVFTEKIFIKELELNGVLYSCEPAPVNSQQPLLIFSPALGASAEDYALLCKELCKVGYTVIGLNYPHTGPGVPKYKEAEIIDYGLQNGSSLEKLIEMIKKGSLPNISASCPIGVIGHSLGGAASIEACRKTNHIQAAINLDGRIINALGVSQPIMQFVCTDVKEDRTAYEKAFEELKNNQGKVVRKELSEKHSVFRNLSPELLENLVKHCTDFFRQHLNTAG